MNKYLNNIMKIFIILAIIMLCLALSPKAIAACPSGPTVEVWKRHQVAISDNTFTGNPFEVVFDGIFVHTSTSTTITMPGFYGGSNTFKINFMPTLEGEWTWTVNAANNDADLQAETGCLNASAATIYGLLRADPANPKKWQHADGTYRIPFAVHAEIIGDPSPTNPTELQTLAEWLGDNEFMVLFHGTNQPGTWDNGRHDYFFESINDPPEPVIGQLDVAIWDRLEERLDALTAENAGFQFYFWTDDDGTPSWGGQTATEALIIRWAVARLAAYPYMVWNSGVDIQEYRTTADLLYWGDLVQSLDPYNHPISSRDTQPETGGDSAQYVNRTFDSILRPIQAILYNWAGTGIPNMLEQWETETPQILKSYDDKWGENRNINETGDGSCQEAKCFKPADIRRGLWKALMAGGGGAIMRCGDPPDTYQESASRGTGICDLSDIWDEVESEQWTRLVNIFLRTKLGATFGTMVPDQSFTTGSGEGGLADPGRTKLLAWQMGLNDGDEPGAGGGVIGLNLTGESGTYTGTWYNPRTGAETAYGSIVAPTTVNVLPPSDTDDDWVFLMTLDGAGGDICGDGSTTGAEVCDDGNTTTETACPYGTPTCQYCNASCTAVLNLSGPYCGDDIINGAEVCDGTDLDDQTCETNGYASGTLACLGDCTDFNFANCIPGTVYNLQGSAIQGGSIIQ